MTACIYHGPPGSYKTFTIIQDVIIPALLSGRSVVTNIRGLDDIDRIEEALGVTVPDEAELIAITHDKEGFEDMARFFHWAPEGALIVMDEGQRVYPSRLRNLSQFDFQQQGEGEGRPTTVEDAFDKHRHFNWDIYISTPFIGKIHNEVRQVCEYAYKHRDVSGFLPWWKNRYRQTKHEPLNNGTSSSHAIGDPKGRKADVRYFNTYQSTATGVAKDSNESKSIFKQKKIYFYGAVMLIAVGIFINSARTIATRDHTPTDLLVDHEVGQARLVFPDSSDPLGSDAVSAHRLDSVASQLLAMDGYYKGSIYRKEPKPDKLPLIHLFSFIDPISENHFEVTSLDLDALGIDIYVSDCLASLTFNNRSKLYTCIKKPPEQRQHSTVEAVERSNASEPTTRSAPHVVFLDDTSRQVNEDPPEPDDPDVHRSRVYNHF